MVENVATLTSNKPQVVVIGRNYVRKEEFFDNPCKLSSIQIAGPFGKENKFIIFILFISIINIL